LTVPAPATPPFWSLHTHSRYSANDALPKVSDLVARAVELGYPALGLTDHGNPSGVVQLYKECRKAGIEPLPGIELYVTPDREAKIQANDHLTVVAYSETGYRNLVTLNNLSQANFHYKPRLDFADFAALAEDGKTQGLAIGTGCYFGAVQQAIIHQGDRAGAQIIKALQGWFPRVYVELHKHNVPAGHNDSRYSEDDLLFELLALAEECGAPTILAADSHYLRPEDQPLHDGLKSLVAFGEDPSEAVFPGGPYSMVDASYFYERLDADIVDDALANLSELANKTAVRIPELDTFTAKMPDVTTSGDADKELRALVFEALMAQGDPAGWAAQVEHELEVMRQIDAAGYQLLAWWVCDFMREKGIWFHTRGSASGSLVNYLLGITQIDPMKGGLRFDRYMSPDRISMPDIDFDVERERRDEVIAALEERFSVRQVGSHMQMGLTSEEEGEEDTSGSLLVKYWTRQSKMAKAGKLPTRTKAEQKWSNVPYADQQMLKRLGGMKLISGPGTHAAGYIVAPDEAAVAELPLTWMAGRSAMVTAYGKKDVEALGFVKLDMLGLRTLTAIRLACTHIAAHPGPDQDPWQTPQEFWDSIPTKDNDTYRRIGRGDTEGIFQLEGKSFTYGCRELKPKSFAEIIAAQALFRPASTQAKVHTRYMARRVKREPIPELHSDILEVTKETYGLPLYQEQVIAACKTLGMSSKELTDLLDALKASNEAVEAAQAYLRSIEPRVRELAQVRGWGEDDLDWLLNALLAYGDYGFNKSHAASYGRVSWRTAYLATHYPEVWWWAMLVAFQGAKRGKFDVEAHYVRCARKYGVRILPAHVNKSAETYTFDGKFVRKGLTAIKGCGRVSAQELVRHAPYASLQDLGERVTARKVGGAKGLALKKAPAECGGVVAALHDYGALDGLEP
jgi:DNA polymerase-3 subunit alpha